MNDAYREADYDEMGDTQSPGVEMDEEYSPGYSQDSLARNDEDAEYDESISNDSDGRDTQPSSQSSRRAEPGSANQQPRLKKLPPPKPANKYQMKIQKNFLAMIAPKSNFAKQSITSIDDQSVNEKGRKIRHMSVQTNPIPFGPSIDSKFLMSEVRPWGQKAEHLPQKGLGLYYSRNPNHLAHATKLEKIKPISPTSPPLKPRARAPTLKGPQPTADNSIMVTVIKSL